MRRLLTASLFVAVSASIPNLVLAQSVYSASPSLAGTRELGLFLSGRVLSDEYSAPTGKTAFGGAVTFATHLSSIFAVQGGLAANYSRQEFTYYKPPLFTFTPTVSLIIQRSTEAAVQPYALVGAGYEFVRFTHPRCDCDQSRSLGVANLGVGVRKMTSGRRAVRFEVTSQIGQGGPAFTALAGMSIFLGTRDQFAPRKRMPTPGKVRTEPPVIRPVQRSTNSGTAPAPAPAPAASLPATSPPSPVATVPVPSNSVSRSRAPQPLPTGVGTTLLQIDGTQIDFSKPTWRTDAEPLLDAIVVDLTSDAGQRVKIAIEAHTDNIGSNAANIMLGLDRARVVRDYLVSQGVSPDRIRVTSSGEDQPIAPNTTAIGRQQNRRIIIKRDN